MTVRAFLVAPSSIVCVAFALALPASAQQFQFAPSQFPTGANNNSFTDAIDYADVDGDGDFDAVCADGGDFGNDQNRLWLNQGGAQGGTIGFFVDVTATQCPVVLDSSRDIEFVDLDLDGDLDVYVSNTSQSSNQTSRWWVNMGGLQGGGAGFYQEQTTTRWSGLSSPNSSLAPSVVLGTGGFIDYACDCDFGDLDNDGDPDLVHSSYGQNSSGQVPTRLFLNDGLGFFAEFNPSGFKLAGTNINNGNPGLWAEGLQLAATSNTTGAQCDIAEMVLDADVQDFDGDLDLDLLLGGLSNFIPRVFQNRLQENGGTLAFRDVTAARMSSSVTGGYDQDVGDVDNDDDVDIYGMNWYSGGLEDVALLNDGAATFGGLQVLPNSGSDDNDSDFLDHDNDGDLDLFVSGFGGEDQLYRNNLIGAGSFSFTDATATTLPGSFSGALDVEAYDIDDDGDADVTLANAGADQLLKNLSNVVDTFAPRCVKLEQAPNRTSGPAPTAVRVQVYDNHTFDETWYHDVRLEYRVVPAAFVSLPMRTSLGQIWRGEIPGSLSGTVEYRVQATDRHGNTGTSLTKSYSANGSGVNYCSSGTTSNGCVSAISGSGAPSASAPSGFTLTLTAAEGQKSGHFFYGLSGPLASPWGQSSHFLCVKAPSQRTGSQQTGGNAGVCDGTFGLDWNSYVATHPGSLGVPFSAGTNVWAQAYFRDPPGPKTTALSNGLQFNLGP